MCSLRTDGDNLKLFCLNFDLISIDTAYVCHSLSLFKNTYILLQANSASYPQWNGK